LNFVFVISKFTKSMIFFKSLFEIDFLTFLFIICLWNIIKNKCLKRKKRKSRQMIVNSNWNLFSELFFPTVNCYRLVRVRFSVYMNPLINTNYYSAKSLFDHNDLLLFLNSKWNTTGVIHSNRRPQHSLFSGSFSFPFQKTRRPENIGKRWRRSHERI